MKSVFYSPFVFWAWILFVPLAFVYGFSDFIRESELNSRLGWWLALSAITLLAKHRGLMGILALPFLLGGVLDLFYAYFFGGVFSTSTLDAVFHTDTGEAGELILAYFTWDALLILLVYAGVAGLLWYRVMLPERLERGLKVLSGLGVLILFFALQQMVVHQRFYDIVPGILGIAPTYAKSSESFEQASQAYRQLVETRAVKVSLEHADQPHTYVIIIGEAMTRGRMALYGYSRLNTPNLQALAPELTVFTNVISPFVQTRPALNAVLFPQSWESPRQTYHQALSIANVAQKAGYKVFWLSNQQPFRTPTQLIADTVDHAAFMTRKVAGVHAHRYDELLLPDIKTALKDPAKHKLIFVHLMGSHLQYANRYPERFSRFSEEPPVQVDAYLADWKKQQINAYDNSILYTDWLIGEIHHLVQTYAKGLSGWMLFSDHGEEVFETANLSGHTPDKLTVPMFTIPVIFWNNQIAKSLQPELKQLATNRHRPYMSDRLYETWMDWLGLRLQTCESCQYSFMRPYVERKRMVYGFDFDQKWSEGGS